jgi:hypothetical protein
MFAQFFSMAAQFFLMLTNLFTAGTKLSNAAVHSASWVEGAAEGFNEIATLERNEKLDTLRGKYDINSRIRAAESALSASDLNAKLKALQLQADAETPAPAAKPAKAA